MKMKTQDWGDMNMMISKKLLNSLMGAEKQYYPIYFGKCHGEIKGLIPLLTDIERIKLHYWFRFKNLRSEKFYETFLNRASQVITKTLLKNILGDPLMYINTWFSISKANISFFIYNLEKEGDDLKFYQWFEETFKDEIGDVKVEPLETLPLETTLSLETLPLETTLSLENIKLSE